MHTSEKGIWLIKEFEGFEAKPYLDIAGVPTIGYGTTRYANGKKVSLKDPEISEKVATAHLMEDLVYFEQQVDAMTNRITQNQFDALVSFSYNLGANALKGSTLLKKVNKNPNDKTIHQEFLRWVYAAGKKSKGLQNRRLKESMLYFS